MQKAVHKDMSQNFSVYPRKWKWRTSRTDINVDHRRMPNLLVFFSGITWDLGREVHIGIVVDRKFRSSGRRYSQDGGRVAQLENQRHYRYFCPKT